VFVKKFIAGLGFLFVLFLGMQQQVAAESIPGNITEDTVWTKEGSPYKVGMIAISPDVTLTVEPGVEIISNGGISWIDVKGKINAKGSAEEKISIKDVIIKGFNYQGSSVKIEYASLSRTYAGGFLVTSFDQEVILRNNVFSNGDVLLGEPKINLFIENNLFHPGAELGLSNGLASILIKGNTFLNEENKGPSVKLSCNDPNCNSANTIITENNFFGFPSFFVEVEKGRGLTYNGANNYWSTTDPSLMKRRILDGAREDRYSSAILDYSPIAYKPFNNGLPLGNMEAPIVNKIGDEQTVVTGLTDADSAVQVWKDGVVIGEGVSTAEGAYTVTIPKQPGGTLLKVTALDSYGRSNAEAAVTVSDTSAPPAPQVNKVNDQETKIEGSTEPGATVIVKVSETEMSTTADSNGSFLVEITPQKAGIVIEVQAMDAAGNLSGITSVTVVDEQPPAKPVITSGELTDQSTFLQGTAEPETSVKMLQDKIVISTAIADQDGHFTLYFNEPFKGSSIIKIAAEDKAENVSEPAVLTVKDITPPTINIDWARYVTEKSNYVFGFAEAGAKIRILKSGSEIETGEADSDRTFAIPIPVQPPGTEMVIVAADAAGNESRMTVTVIDLPDPLPLTINPINTQTTMITGKTEPNASVNITIQDAHYVVQANPEGNFELKITSLATGTPVSVLVNDHQGQYSEEAVVTVAWKAPSGWYKDPSGNPYYYDPVTGQAVKGWLQLGSKKYYFQSTGIMHKGWLTLSGKKYYFDGNGVMKTAWLTLAGKKYYFDSYGVMQTGWKSISNKKYYFSSSGVMTKGWLTLSGKKYYFDSYGVMQTGRETISSKKYYFSSSGVMTKGWLMLSGKQYYFDSYGVMQTGWETISSKKYYFSSSGVMTKGWLTLSGKKYYFDSYGVMQTGWETISKKKYYFSKSGVMTKGWLTLSGKKYYFDSNGLMQTGWKKINSKWYYFNSKGVKVK
jgi:glucan-binding YG repeat protein